MMWSMGLIDNYFVDRLQSLKPKKKILFLFLEVPRPDRASSMMTSLGQHLDVNSINPIELEVQYT
jgi:hypothetical protein